MSLGYEGSYNRVAAFAREWKADLQIELQTTGCGAYVPLAFEPGEAFQFDWSEDWAIIGNERTKLQVAHSKLSNSGRLSSGRISCRHARCCSTSITHAFRELAASPRRGIYDNMRTAIDKIGRGKDRDVNIRLMAMPATTSTSPSSAIRHLAGRRARSRRMSRMPVNGSFNRSRALHRWKPSTTGWSFDAGSFGSRTHMERCAAALPTYELKKHWL
jgi:hypothetical protein